jgi:hypothetical protein
LTGGCNLLLNSRVCNMLASTTQYNCLNASEPNAMLQQETNNYCSMCTLLQPPNTCPPSFLPLARVVAHLGLMDTPLQKYGLLQSILATDKVCVWGGGSCLWHRGWLELNG